MKNSIMILVLSLGVFLITGLAVSYQSEHAFTLKFFSSGDEGFDLLWRNIIFVIAMLAGIIMGHLHSTLSNSETQRISGEDLKTALTHKTLWISMLASPIVFGVVYVLNERQPNTVMATLLAFENGFFCNSILRKRSTLRVTAPSKPPRTKTRNQAAQ